MSEKVKTERIILEILREQDFGSFECQSWASRSAAKGPRSGNPVSSARSHFKPKETHESMTARMNTFLDDIIHPILATDSGPESTLAVVSHGIILSFLWRALLQRFGPRSVALGPGISALAGNKPLEYLPTWSNTGYLELEIMPAMVRHDIKAPQSVQARSRMPTLTGYQMTIKTVNGKEHLNKLKRARGGLGSSAFDSKQKRLEGFFKKPKTEGKYQKLG
jgi:Histidine phosphatase superfamily (branch 1)